MIATVFYPPKRLTLPANKPQNDCTTTLIGNPAPHKSCGFFVPVIRQCGPLTYIIGTGTRQFSKIGAYWATWRTKAGNRTNKPGRINAVVESSMRLPSFKGGATIIFRLGATAMQHYAIDNTPNTGETRQNSNQTTLKASTGLVYVRDCQQGGPNANR